MRALLRRLGTRTGISASLLLVVAAVVLVARLVGGPSSTPGTYAQPNPGLPSVGPSAGDDGQVVTTPSASVDDTPVRSAATTFTQAWLRQDLSPEAWHDALAPLVTQSLSQRLAGVDPVVVPATRITGDPLVTLHSDQYALISVPVDTGVVELGLLKQSDQWLVDTLDWQRT